MIQEKSFIFSSFFYIFFLLRDRKYKAYSMQVLATFSRGHLVVNLYHLKECTKEIIIHLDVGYNFYNNILFAMTSETYYIKK